MHPASLGGVITQGTLLQDDKSSTTSLRMRFKQARLVNELHCLTT